MYDTRENYKRTKTKKERKKKKRKERIESGAISVFLLKIRENRLCRAFQEKGLLRNKNKKRERKKKKNPRDEMFF